MNQKEVSLGIIKPRIIEDFIIEKTERDWKPEWLAKMNQLSLFGDRKPLEKIPYKFRYKFRCLGPNCPGHNMMIEDWEVGQLYRNMRDKYKSEDVACQKVKDTFYNKICGEDKDTYFYVGTVYQYNRWIVIGTFYPNKEFEQITIL